MGPCEPATVVCRPWRRRRGVPGVVGKNSRICHFLEDRGLALEVLDFLLRRSGDGLLLRAQRPRGQGDSDRSHALELAQGDDEEAAVGGARLRDLLGFILTWSQL